MSPPATFYVLSCVLVHTSSSVAPEAVSEVGGAVATDSSRSAKQCR
jgi:hypothetical protein